MKVFARHHKRNDSKTLDENFAVTTTHDFILLTHYSTVPQSAISEDFPLLMVSTHDPGYILAERRPLRRKTAVRIIRHRHIRDEKSHDAIVGKVHNRLDVVDLRRGAAGIRVNKQSGLMRIDAISIQCANISSVVHGFRILKYIDKISDRPVARIDLHAGVEEGRFAVSESVSGEGGDVAHVIDLIWAGGRFVEKDPTDVDVFLCGASPVGPVLVGGDIGLEAGQILRSRADVVMGDAAVVLCGSVHVPQGFYVGMRVEGRQGIDVVDIRAGTTAGAVIGVDHHLKDEGWVGSGGIEERLPGIEARVDIERKEDETGIDHDGDGILNLKASVV